MGTSGKQKSYLPNTFIKRLHHNAIGPLTTLFISNDKFSVPRFGYGLCSPRSTYVAKARNVLPPFLIYI